MRFITEFELDGNINTDLLPHITPDKKHIRELGIGQDIGRSFGWDEKGQTTLNPQSPVIHKFKLEIEAFPMDKWIEFKQKLFNEIDCANICDIQVNSVKILELIKELECCCKPSGDAITNQQLNK